MQGLCGFNGGLAIAAVGSALSTRHTLMCECKQDCAVRTVSTVAWQHWFIFSCYFPVLFLLVTLVTQ